MIRNIGEDLEIRCPYCFSFISISQNKNDNLNLTTNCENCGSKDISLDAFLISNQNLKIKSCNFCCKNFQTNEMLYSVKCHNFLCKRCYFILFKQKLIIHNDYIYFSELGKNCLIHKNINNLFFCESCNRHICSQCLVKHRNFSHKIKNLRNESKKYYNIEEMKYIIKQEEKEIESEEKFGQELLNSMKKIFEDDINNRKDLFNFKTSIYREFKYNINNNFICENIEKLVDEKKNPDFFVNNNNLNELEKILNEINKDSSINNINKIDQKNNNFQEFQNILNSVQNYYNEINLSKEEIEKRRANSLIKQNKKYSQNNPKFSNKRKEKTPIKSIHNNGNKSWQKFTNNRSKNLYTPTTPIKTQRYKNKKFIVKSNDIINKQTQNNNSKFFYSGINISLPKENKNNESLSIIQNLNYSIIKMIYLGSNKILISLFSTCNNLILCELFKNRKINNKIDMNILIRINLSEKPIILMDILENGNVLSCTEDKVRIFKICDKNIIVKNIFDYDNILACISLENEKFLVVQNNIRKNINEIYYYFYETKNISTGYKTDSLEIPEYFKVISIEKISNFICALMLQKTNYLNNDKNVIYLKILNLKNNKISCSNEKEFIFNERETIKKIFIKKLFDNLIIISVFPNSFFAYDYQNDIIKANIKCDTIISSIIKEIDSEQVYLYTIENKENDGKLMEEIKIKKYLIKKINKPLIILGNNTAKNEIEIIEINCSQLLGYNKNNKINDMILINEDNRDEKDNNGINKNLILFADNTGNLLYKYY